MMLDDDVAQDFEFADVMLGAMGANTTLAWAEDLDGEGTEDLSSGSSADSSPQWEEFSSTPDTTSTPPHDQEHELDVSMLPVFPGAPKIDVVNGKAISPTAAHVPCSPSETTSEGMLANALLGTVPLPPQALDLLLELRAGGTAWPETMPRRSTASPINPTQSLAFICDPTVETQSRSRESISVTYQSVGNSSIYWDNDHRYGVVARLMGRSCRSKGKGGEIHGYQGRWICLVEHVEEQSEDATKRRDNLARLVQNAPSLVVVWPRATETRTKKKAAEAQAPQPESNKRRRADNKLPARTLSSRAAAASYESDSLRDVTVVPHNMHIHGNLVVDGVVSGRLNGQLVTQPGAADYAEWFPRDDVAGERVSTFPPGSVCQLRAPQQQLSLRTDGTGPTLVVSTCPSIAAGVPANPDESARGELVAFLGQVPVRVRGPIKCGDQLVPSGKNDGCAISLDAHIFRKSIAKVKKAFPEDKDRRRGKNKHGKKGWFGRSPSDAVEPVEMQPLVSEELSNMMMDPLGTSMEDCDEGEHTVLAFVRWRHNLKHEVAAAMTRHKKAVVRGHWKSHIFDCFKNRGAFRWYCASTFAMPFVFANTHWRLGGSRYRSLLGGAMILAVLTDLLWLPCAESVTSHRAASFMVTMPVGMFVYVIMVLYVAMYRSRLREKLFLGGSDIEDLLSTSVCMPCVIAQEAREVERVKAMEEGCQGPDFELEVDDAPILSCANGRNHVGALPPTIARKRRLLFYLIFFGSIVNCALVAASWKAGFVSKPGDGTWAKAEDLDFTR